MLLRKKKNAHKPFRLLEFPLEQRHFNMFETNKALDKRQSDATMT